MSTTREYILRTVRENTRMEKTPYPQIPDFPKNSKPILEEFKESLTEAGGTWKEVSGPEEAARLILELHPDARVICSATPEIEGNKDIAGITDPHDMNDVDVGVIRADFGVSETGMVWLREKDLKVNSLGVLAQHLVILLDPQRIVKDMYEAYGKVDLEANNYGCFMMGPSATADIGAVMVQGAQGARSLSVFIMQSTFS